MSQRGHTKRNQSGERETASGRGSRRTRVSTCTGSSRGLRGLVRASRGRGGGRERGAADLFLVPDNDLSGAPVYLDMGPRRGSR